MAPSSVKLLLLVIAVSSLELVLSQKTLKIPKTSFNCEGRPSGYYADLETGCQIYHMCDGLGRQFSYSCPNTTLFQQRMLVCDHWYMVNCSAAEQNYNVNNLIGQRDKPFVPEEENHQRTPRPDILSVPYSQSFNKYTEYDNKNIVDGIDDNSIISSINDLKIFPVPTHWSTELTNSNKYTTAKPFNNNKTNQQKTRDVNSSTQQSVNFGNNRKPNGKKIATASSDYSPNISTVVDPPSKFFQPPKIEPPEIPIAEQTTHINRKKLSSTTARSIASFNNELLSGSTKTDNFQASAEEEQPFNIDVRTDTSASVENTARDASVVNFINSLTTNSTNFEIQTSSETAGFATQNFINPSVNKQPSNNDNFNTIDNNSLNTEGLQPIIVASTGPDDESEIPPPPPRELLPPKTQEYSEIGSTTMGPPIYYEWKWAVPAIDLEPPKFGSVEGKPHDSSNDTRPAFALPRSTTQRSIDIDLVAQNATSDNHLNFTSYFIPDYVFPLDKQHPGYGENGALTSFQVKIPIGADAETNAHPNYGENPECPQCHPSFVVPGTCKPCVMIRR